MPQEVVPALIRVLSPQVRALAPHLLTPVEQAAMAHTVRVTPRGSVACPRFM